MKFFGSISRLVSILFRKNGQDITLRPNQATTYTLARDIQTPPQDADSVLVSENASQALINKTIVAASNTITTAASGNLAATSLNPALAELQSDIDTRATQTSLDNHINNTTGAHAASAISNVPAGNLAAANVQLALNELQSDIDTRATNSYVDNAVQGLSWKQPARVASVADVVIATGLANLSVIDGITLATGDRVLLKNQTAPAENGLYLVPASGAASRTSDANTAAEVAALAVFIQEGTVNADKGFVQTAEVATLGTSALAFAQFSSAGSYTFNDSASVDFTTTGQSISAAVLPAGVNHDALANFVANKHIDHSAVQIATSVTSGLNGGGDITATRNIVSAPERATAETVASADEILFADASAANVLRKTTAGAIAALAAGSPTQSFTWVDGSATKSCTHTFSTSGVLVEIYDENGETVMIDKVDRFSATQVDLTRSEATAGGAWTVLIRG